MKLSLLLSTFSIIFYIPITTSYILNLLNRLMFVHLFRYFSNRFYFFSQFTTTEIITRCIILNYSTLTRFHFYYLRRFIFIFLNRRFFYLWWCTSFWILHSGWAIAEIFRFTYMLNFYFRLITAHIIIIFNYQNR